MTQELFDRPLVEIVDNACDLHGDKPCLLFGEEVYSYTQVKQESIKVAQGLQAAGFEKGMHGAVYSQNSARAFIVLLGIIRAGGVWIPVNPRNSLQDNADVLERLGCDAVFYQDVFADIAELAGKVAPLKLAQSLNDANDQGYTSWLAGTSDDAVNVVVEPTDLVAIPTTGGTTGLPKGVMLSDRNFRALSYAMCEMLKREGETPALICAAPMTHVAGRIVIASMMSGGKYFIKDKVDAQDILETIEREKISDIFLPPTAIYALLAQPNVRDFDYSSLRALSYGSAPMSVEQLRLALDVFGPVMRGGFGQTECPMMISELRPEDHFIDGAIAPESRLRSVGRATVISEIAILDDEGKPLPANERGEIAVKGGMVSEGYFQQPEETEKIRFNGWHLTGDIGYLNEEGFLYIVDRKKDMIITGGFNVYSAEVELALSSIEGIASAVVIGVPSEQWGEEVKALVQRSAKSDITEAQIIAQAKEKIGSVKSPKSVEFVEDFPKTYLGKVDKKQIRQSYWKDAGRSI